MSVWSLRALIRGACCVVTICTTLAPAGTSREIVMRLNGAVRKALALPDIRAFWATNGVDTVDTTPEQFATRLRQDYERYGRLIDQLGLAVK